MKRYLVFTYQTYYPSGGMEDFLCSIDSLDELDKILKESEFDMFQVYDIINQEHAIQEMYISDYIKQKI
jgi:hypothetical protein